MNRTEPCRRGAALLVLAGLVAGAPIDATAQVLRGRLVDEVNASPVAGAVLTLRTASGAEAAQALSDSLGRFALRVPEPGPYRVAAVRLGYHELLTPLLQVEGDSPAELELLLHPLPVGLEGFEVEADREQRYRDELALFGLRPEALGNRLVTREEIDAVRTARHLGDILKWQNIPGLQVVEPENSPQRTVPLCISLRRARRGSGMDTCALVVLDGQVVRGEVLELLHPGSVEAVVVLHPADAATVYGTLGGSGAVLVFTRRGR